MVEGMGEGIEEDRGKAEKRTILRELFRREISALFLSKVTEK